MKTHSHLTRLQTISIIKNPIRRILSLLVLLSAGEIPAAPINWSTSTVSGPADVSIAGTLVGALNAGPGGLAQTINGVTFAPDPGGAGALPLGQATVGLANFGKNYHDFWRLAHPGGSAAYAAALDYGRWQSPGSGTITLGGLVSGRTYLVQLWIVDTRAVWNTKVRTVDGVSTAAAGPNLATGTFIASGATQVITIGDTGAGYGTLLNMIQLRVTDRTPILVTNTNDAGTGSLRQALAAAATSQGPDTIAFGPALSGRTIAVESHINISDTNVIVDATALPQGITIRSAAAIDDRLVFINPASFVAFRGISFSEGGGPDFNSEGGAIYNYGRVSLFRCKFTGNKVLRFGGAIYNDDDASIELTECTLSGNSAGLHGGAISNDNGNLTLTKCTLSGNECSGRGGAITSYTGSSLLNGSTSLNQCTLAGNRAAEGGGGIFNHRGQTTLTHCTISRNFAPAAGGVGSYGGAIGGPETLTQIAYSIISENSNSDVDHMLTSPGATIRSLGYNIIGTGNAAERFNRPGDIISSNPGLAPLGDYGGPTQTMALLPGSPALQAAAGSSVETGQRGIPLAGVADIGAFESGTVANFNSWIWESLPAEAGIAQHETTFDFDGDGQSNQAEWLALSNPADPLSRFEVIQQAMLGGEFSLTFRSVVERAYQIEYSTNLTSWELVSGGPYPGSGDPMTIRFTPGGGSRGFYARVRVQE